MTVLPPGSDGPAGHGGRGPARHLARPGLAVAASAPVAVVALGSLPHYAPAGLLALVLSLAAATVVVVAAGISGSESGEDRHHTALSTDRWLARWPGVARAGAICWWLARLGAAGLLTALAFEVAGTGHGAAMAALAVLALAALSAAPVGRPLMAVALATVAATGAAVTASGIVALSRGRLTTAVLAADGTHGAGLLTAGVHWATTVVLVCLMATCLVAAGPALSRGAARAARWAIWAGVGTAVPCWAVAMPVLARAGGLSPATVAGLGGPRALTAALAVVLGPLGGPEALEMARGTISFACLAGAFGAIGAGTGVASKALCLSRSARSGRRAPWPIARLADREGTAVVTAGATGLLAGGAALVGPRPWLVVALGVVATIALVLSALAPPLVRQHQRLPRPLRVAVALVAGLAVAGAVGAAGTWAVGGAGALAVAGAVVAGPKRVRTALTEVFGPTRRQRSAQLGQAAAILAEKALPGLVSALEAVAAGAPARPPVHDLAELKAAVRPLEAALAGDWRPQRLTAMSALVDASRQVARLAACVEAVADLDSNRLEELVEVRIGALAHANRNLVNSQWRRRQLLERTVRVAEEERARIAANLHDGPIQRLAALGLVLDRCRLRMDRDDNNGARDLVKRARTELSEEIRSLRQMMSELRPPILDEGGLEAALRDHLSSWSSTSGIETRFEAGSHGLLSLDSETVVYRVVQEALANVAKHSRADFTTVTMSQSSQGVQVVVRDNGKGFDAPSQPELLRGGHFGLVVMRERVELASGRFEVHSAPRTGTEVMVWLPTISAHEPVEVG